MPFDKVEISIDQEIENWQSFGYAMRQEDRELFKKMMLEAMTDNEAFDMANSKDPTEALLMVLIFQQQKMIIRLIKTLEKR